MEMTHLWQELELWVVWPLESDGVCLGMVGHGK